MGSTLGISAPESMQNPLPPIGRVQNEKNIPAEKTDGGEGHFLSPDQFDKMMKKKFGEASQPPISGNTTSDTSVIEEVRQAIRAELKQNLKNQGINPGLHDSAS